MPHPPIVDPRFPSRLRELRTARGWSLRELARRAYYGKSQLQPVEAAFQDVAPPVNPLFEAC
ncbi:multiprotein-bridging factor 1 family protein [Plantactinospora solaniradicis]|uniref:Multiprotein-bridging factor 1 family protein n=1 Tax=Plantactinospora solaniradicis TaxID=1723736 RepID=A0ABW1KT10_9ACTN